MSSPSLPLALMVVVCALSLAARAAWLGDPCRSPCRASADHVLIFDESYYVNAARVIAGIHPPAGQTYADSPLGVDPNSEHPQLVKLLIAGSIELLGDGPLAWRLGSLVFGTLAIVGMFALVRAGGGGRWPALGAAALMAADNLMIVHGRIGTLDIYVAAAMIWAVAAYLRGRPLLAGLLLGLAACMKLVALYALLVLVALEGLHLLLGRREGWKPVFRLAGAGAAAAATLVALLALMDRIARPYNETTHTAVTGGPLGHLGHMISYAATQTSPHGPRGIASYPIGWLVDYKPIVYLNVNPAEPAAGLYHVHPAVHFLGLISPPILLLALPALAFAAVRVWRGRRPRAESDLQLPVLALAWFLGTFIPFELLSLIWSRTSYLYYMVVVLPGMYVGAAWLLSASRRRPRLTAAWIAAVVAAAVVAYPLTPLP